jgi:molybdopterin molybdotransferase
MHFSPADADAAIRAHAPRLPTVCIALRDAAGSVLHQDVVAERDQPPFDRVSMDGIAIDSRSNQRTFRINGTQAAGAAPLQLQSSNDCIEAMTGAMLPNGCDCVIPVEKLHIKNGHATLDDNVVTSAWLNVHRRGLDCHAGRIVLQPGAILSAPELAVVASAGLMHVNVARTPRIVVISTGNELVEPGQPLQDWQIRRSNVYSVLAALRKRGFTRVADDHIADDQNQLRERLKQHLETADVLILSGGVSMGKFDFVPRVLADLGVREIFHKIAQRPGKPMWFGVRDTSATHKTAVYALPGNPVSTLVCLARYVMPGLQIAMGADAAPTLITLNTEQRALPTLWKLLPVILSNAGQASPQPTQGSGDFTSLIGSNGLVELPPAQQPIAQNTLVPFYSW